MMAAVLQSVQPVTSGLIKLSLAVNCAAKTREMFWSLFAQVWFVLAEFWVIWSQDRAWRIFQFARIETMRALCTKLECKYIDQLLDKF